jgi:hypothetical protein
MESRRRLVIELKVCYILTKEIMLRDKYLRYIPINIKRYREHLDADLIVNTGPKEIVEKIFFPNSITVGDWLNNVEGHLFTSVMPKTELQFQKFDPFEQLSLYREQHTFFKMPETRRYEFFSKIECSSYEEVRTRYPDSFYCFDNNFSRNVDTFFFSGLSGFHKEKEGTFAKQISENVRLVFTSNNLFISTWTIDEYLFPELSIEIKGEQFLFFIQSDFRSLLLLDGTSFGFFYSEGIEAVNSSPGTHHFRTKEGEPVVYHNEKSGKFIITNSYEKLDKYNFFIVTIVSLYWHYLKVFERWITKEDQDGFLSLAAQSQRK